MREELFGLTCMLALVFLLIKHTTEVLLLMVLTFCLLKKINEPSLREQVLDAAGVLPDIYFL